MGLGLMVGYSGINNQIKKYKNIYIVGKGEIYFLFIYIF